MTDTTWERSGEGSPLVLIHGFTDTRRTWEAVLPHLTAEHAVLSVSLLGHAGGPPLPPGTLPTVEALTDQLERDLDAAGLERAHLVGNSLGGWLALELAARHRGRSVVALAPGGGWKDGTAPRRVALRFRAAGRMARAAAPHAERLMRRPRLRALALRDVVARPERVPPAMAAHLVRGSADCEARDPFLRLPSPYPERLEPVDCPVRIAWGSRDRILPERIAAVRFAELVPQAERVELDGLGHLPQHDDPLLVARTILEVTRRVDAAAREEGS